MCAYFRDGLYILYVLVVDKKFVETEEFGEFIENYNRAAESLNDPEILAGKLGVEEDWLKDKKIRFLTLGQP